MISERFLRAVVQLARNHGVLVIFDEVMTGFGRTGAPFAMERAGISPDVVCISKGLTGGFLPLSVTVASDAIYERFLADEFDKAFAHGHSFTANPLGCAAALASIEILKSDETARNWQRIETVHRECLGELSHRRYGTQFRVMGTIGAFNISVPDAGYEATIGPRLKRAFLEHGFLIRPLGNVVYLMPPYCTESELIQAAWQTIDTVVQDLGL